jgi:iron complex transport system ATP-binding protein
VIKVSDLSYFVGKKPILQDVTFSIQKNDFVLIFGQNGAGKSTLLKILAGSLSAQRGEVFVDGKNIAHFSKRELATKVSFLPQLDDFCLPLLVKDVLLSGRYPYQFLFKNYSNRDFEIYKEAVDCFVLGDLINRNIQTLSAGERKKVLLATAFIQDVPIILLDEPMNFLDPASIFQMIKMLEGLHRMGKTILLVSHLIEYFFPYANKLLALKNGKNYYFGEKTFSPELFQAIYQVDYKRLFVKNKEIIFVNE